MMVKRYKEKIRKNEKDENDKEVMKKMPRPNEFF